MRTPSLTFDLQTDIRCTHSVPKTKSNDIKHVNLSVVIQDSCARVLLFRGANKEMKNYNSQTAFQVCVCACGIHWPLCVTVY